MYIYIYNIMIFEMHDTSNVTLAASIRRVCMLRMPHSADVLLHNSPFHFGHRQETPSSAEKAAICQDWGSAVNTS